MTVSCAPRDDHAWGLPSALAVTRLLYVADPGGAFGVVHNPRMNTFTVTLRCAATSTWLADVDEGAAWVGSWGGWLASLGHQPAIHHVAVNGFIAHDDPEVVERAQYRIRAVPHYCAGRSLPVLCGPRGWLTVFSGHPSSVSRLRGL
jgi:hypothetical protein